MPFVSSGFLPGFPKRLKGTHRWTNPAVGDVAAPNYGEARGAESHADFVHKVRIFLKELNETSVWLRIIQRAQLLSGQSLSLIIEENTSLCKIFTASLKPLATLVNDK